MRGWTFHELFCIAAAVCFFVAFAVSVGWFAHNWEAWLSAGAVFFAAAALPWRTP